jgi:hypothetical protein
VRNGIYRIREVRDSGVLVIHGKCGTLAEVHSTNCAPCHLTNINPVIDSSLQYTRDGQACRVCSFSDRADVMLVCDGCQQGYHLDCLDPPLEAVPDDDIWCCSECIGHGITPATLEELLRRDQRLQGVDQPELRDMRQEREDKAASMDGQPIMLRVLEPGKPPLELTGKLEFLQPLQRKDQRRPLRLHTAGFLPVDLPVSKAAQATRSRMDIALARVPVPAAQALAAVSSLPSTASASPVLKDTYDLLSVHGFTALYQDVLGTTSGLPTEGHPSDWVPELSWVTGTSGAVAFEEPLTDAAVGLLFASVDIQSCFRVADPVARSPVLAGAVQRRYQRALLSSSSSPPTLSNWLTPLHYRRLATKGPVDWVFLYPPLSIADLSLALAVSRARVGVSMWIPRSYLSALTPTRLQLLSAFKSSRRLAVVHSWDSDSLWVCVFTSSAHRSRMLCPSSAVATAWTSF